MTYDSKNSDQLSSYLKYILYGGNNILMIYCTRFELDHRSDCKEVRFSIRRKNTHLKNIKHFAMKINAILTTKFFIKILSCVKLSKSREVLKPRRLKTPLGHEL